MMTINRNLVRIAVVFILCLISLVHVFLFPMYGSSLKVGVGRPMPDFEQRLCVNKLQSSRTWWQWFRFRCPPGGVVTVPQGGRLGNQMWEYASVWAVARRTGLDPYVPRCIRLQLDEVFETLTVPTLDEIVHCSVRLNEPAHSVEKWKFPKQSIVLPSYARLTELVLILLKDIIQEFTFRRQLRKKSEQVLAAAARLRNDTSVFVGVHVRRTDYVGYLWRLFRVELAKPTYFLNAMDYFESRYHSVVFVVVSDEPEWCVRYLTGRRNVYVTNRESMNSPGQDLSIMAACNHSIIDYGTYGVWGAILAGGENIFYNASYNLALRVSKSLPNWHTLPYQQSRAYI